MHDSLDLQSLLGHCTETFGTLFEADTPTVVMAGGQAPIITLCRSGTLRLDIPLLPAVSPADEAAILERAAKLNGTRALLRAQMFFCLSPSGSLLLSSLTRLTAQDCHQVIVQNLERLCAAVQAARAFLLGQSDHHSSPELRTIHPQNRRVLRG
ncbi:hypothetical protein P5705_14110 [Pseudomonas entomophila]|uniref:hypothetical protein n=1 Tax=Pseudomonas entomophila TaxID=312306 RepID=UPI00240621E1|nr:hypothetical protein [Pseudomonas entomophila]MDF9618782.1 hypothetical protein [Pseudomonas entomophila]